MPTNFGEVLTPLGTPDGSQNTFQADAEGNGAFSLKMKALLPSSSITFENYTAMYVTRIVSYGFQYYLDADLSSLSQRWQNP
jgi:hypothetical protein